MSTQAKIEEIALYLGRPWKYSRLGEPSDWRFEVIDGYGRSLCFRLEKERLKIIGLFPPDRCIAYRDDYKEISVNIRRSAKDIAKDISRRLLPDYLKSYESALLRYKQEQKRNEHLDLIAHSIMQVTQGKILDYSRASRTVCFDKGTVEIWSSGDINLNIRCLSVTQAMQIISLLKNEDGEL